MRATIHRRGALKVPEETYRNCILHGWLVSPYTAKVRSLLAHKLIPFKDSTPSAIELYMRVRPSVGRVIMPTARLASGQWRQDSALMCDEIEAEHPEPSCKPPGAAQNLASLLLENYADEWLPMLALHHRWNTATNAEWAVGEFGRCGFPFLPSMAATRLVAPFASKMKSFRRVQGISSATHDGLDRHSASLISNLQAHLSATNQPFLLGGRPCRGDFALYGPLWAHLFRDPFSRPLFESAPEVVRWIERLHGHAADPAFPELPCRVEPPSPETSAGQLAGNKPGLFLPADDVPQSLDPVFRTIFEEQWPFLAALSDALDAHLDEKAVDEEDVTRVPRALAYAPFAVGGAQGERRQLTYSAWRLRRPLDFYESLEMAPSRSLELAKADAWLTRLGAFEAFRDLKPRWRIERRNELPQKQESLYARRAQHAGRW